MTLRVAGGRLVCFHSVLLPDGLHADGRVFAWAHATNAGRPAGAWPVEPPTGWTLSFRTDTRAFFVTTVVAVCELWHGETRPVAGIGRYWQPFAPLLVPSYAALQRAAALVSFLRDEPRARDGLADPARAGALAAALRSFDPRRGLPREPPAGDAYDLHWAGLRAYRAALPRRYHDLRVDTDPPPGDLGARIRAELPARLRDRVGDDRVAACARRFASAPAWPFGVLL